MKTLVIGIAAIGTAAGVWIGMGIEHNKSREAFKAASTARNAVPVVAPASNFARMLGRPGTAREAEPITADRAIAIALATAAKGQPRYDFQHGKTIVSYDSKAMKWNVSVEGRPKPPGQRDRRIVASLVMAVLEVTSTGNCANPNSWTMW